MREVIPRHYSKTTLLKTSPPTTIEIA